MGMGRGMGFKRWQTTGPYVPPLTSPPLTQLTSTGMLKEQEMQVLESQMNVLQQQLDQIKKHKESELFRRRVGWVVFVVAIIAAFLYLWFYFGAAPAE